MSLKSLKFLKFKTPSTLQRSSYQNKEIRKRLGFLADYGKNF